MMIADPGSPCPMCGVRPDVTCQHRKAVVYAQSPETKEDRRVRISGGGMYRQFHAGQGLNFKRPKG